MAKKFVTKKIGQTLAYVYVRHELALFFVPASSTKIILSKFRQKVRVKSNGIEVCRFVFSLVGILYVQYRNGKISADRAAAIAKGAPNDAEIQRAALASSEGMDSTTLEIHARRLAAYKNEVGAQSEGVQGDLFGEDDSAIKEMVAISKAAGELVKENRQKILAVKGVVKRPEVAKEMGVDINDPEAVKAAIADLERENQMLMSPTPDRNILNKIRAKAGLAKLPNVEEETVVEPQADSENVGQGDTLDFGLAESGSIRKGDYFRSAKKELLADKDTEPKLLDNNGTDYERFSRAEAEFNAMPMYTRAADGVNIKLKVSEGGSFMSRIVHMISDNKTGAIDSKKLAWLPNIKNTIENAQLRLKGKYDTRKQSRREPNRIYIRRYNDGTIHAVVVSPFGEIIGQDIKDAGVITQYPVDKIGEIYEANVDWINPKMTEASAETTEAPQLNDLSHKGTVPLPKANGPTSENSAISDSRSQSMVKESENSSESQAENSQNDSGASGSVRHKGSTPFAGGGVSDSARANADYQALKNAAQEVRKANPSMWSRWISKSRAYLPKNVNFNRALNRIEGVPSIGDIRRYAQKVLDIPIAKKMRLDNPAWLGVYDRDMQYIRTRSGHYNDFDVLAHEIGHYLETIFFGNTLGEAKLNVASELRGYCYERFGDAYPAEDMAREGWAQFISDVLNDVNDAKLKCPIA